MKTKKWRLALAGLAAAATLAGTQREMDLVQLHVDSFTVVGLETRTDNAREATAESRIGPLWNRLGRRELTRIQNRVDDRVVAIYSDYETDKDGPYTYLLGAKVSSAKEIPEGMVAREVVTGNYAEFSSAYDNPLSVVNLWKKIWLLEKPAGQLHRAYRTDFEVYSGGGGEGPPTNVDIYIGLKK